MKKIRVLAIAPYEGLKKMMLDVAADRMQFDLHAYVGDLDAGVKLANDLQNKGFDLIVSRGGTAEMIGKVANIPVVEIKLSEYDILHAIKLAQNYTGKFAVVGFSNIIERVETICRLIGISIDTCVIKHGDEAQDCLSDLKRRGYTLVVGDTVTTTIAKNMHINGILITTGQESMLSAFDEAEKIYRAMGMAQEQNLFFREVMDHSQIGVFVYNREKRLVYSNYGSEAVMDDYSTISRSILPCIPKVLEDGSIHIMRKSKGYLWQIDGLRGGEGHDGYVYFYIRRSIDVSLLDKALSYRDMLSESEAAFHPFYDNSDTTQPILEVARKFAGTELPILIMGEAGTGKDTLAWIIHQNSSYREKPFLSINCRVLDRKQLNYLLRNENSPLGETGMSIYIKNTHCLDDESRYLLINYLGDTSLHRRNRVIYSSQISPSQCEKDVLLSYLIHEDEHDCMNLILPSLRERKEDIPSLASVYINELNVTLGKQVAGLDDESIRLLQEFPWQFNIDQFIKVLRELVLMTSGAFIQEGDTRRALLKESKFQPDKVQASLLQGTLDEITSNLIRMVFEEEGMNQTRTAKRLGISRSTMWRKLKL